MRAWYCGFISIRTMYGYLVASGLQTNTRAGEAVKSQELKSGARAAEYKLVTAAFAGIQTPRHRCSRR